MAIFQSLLCGTYSSLYFMLHWKDCKENVQTVVWKYWGTGRLKKFYCIG